MWQKRGGDLRFNAAFPTHEGFDKAQELSLRKNKTTITTKKKNLTLKPGSIWVGIVRKRIGMVEISSLS